jgi:trimethylamine---corrinoid protein Co-methyltransferase
VHNLPVYEILSADGLETIHQASMQILGESASTSMTRRRWRFCAEHGARVEGETVYFDEALVLEYVAKAPAQFTQLARNPENNVVVGGNHICFAPVYGPPFVMDMERGRRSATLKDFQNFVKLAYLSPYIHHSGGTVVEPTDRAGRHAPPGHGLQPHPLQRQAVYGLGHVRRKCRGQRGHGRDRLRRRAIREQPALISLINISSPRRLDDRMLGALKTYAKARQATIITPFILSGAMAPVTVAGTLAQQNAEALAGIVFAQMCEPGAPVVYGSFQTNVDLQTGAPVFGSPESQLALFASAQLARRYNLPFRSGGMFTASKVADAQAAYESVQVMLPTMLARVNFVLHAAGWLEGGLTAGYEKFVLDDELLGMYHTFLQGIDTSTEALAMESQRTVPAGGHHLGTEHTMAHFRTAFYRAELFDANSYDQWAKKGLPDAYQRANTKVQSAPQRYEPPDLDPAVDAALKELSPAKEDVGSGSYAMGIPSHTPSAVGQVSNLRAVALLLPGQVLTCPLARLFCIRKKDLPSSRHKRRLKEKGEQGP